MSLLFQNVSKKYDDRVVLDDFNLEIEAGEILAIYGESGAGLSTLASLLSDLDSPEEGKILLEGKEVSASSPIACLYPNSQLYAHLTLKDNFKAYLRNSPLKESLKEERIALIGKRLQLTPLLDKKPNELTGGQYLRALIGKNLLDLPKVLVFDDALLKIDGKTRTTFWKEIKKIRSDFALTILFLTHYAPEAMHVGDRVAYLKCGRIVACDKPENLYAQPMNIDVATAFAFPSISYLKAAYEKGRLLLKDTEIILDEETKKNHDAFYENALKGLREDSPSYLPYSRAKEERHTLILGLHAEDILLEENGLFEGEVTIVEKRGSRFLIHLSFDGGEVLAFSEKEIPIASKARFSFRKEKMFLFDPLSQKRI